MTSSVTSWHPIRVRHLWYSKARHQFEMAKHYIVPDLIWPSQFPRQTLNSERYCDSARHAQASGMAVRCEVSSLESNLPPLWCDATVVSLSLAPPASVLPHVWSVVIGMSPCCNLQLYDASHRVQLRYVRLYNSTEHVSSVTSSTSGCTPPRSTYLQWHLVRQAVRVHGARIFSDI